eukprot:GEMP01024371.1.p1 GENE.GEMP01024371.1~~GEMP01024371.1.p1  ORF type:complete len:552 (+),score=121.87 GEMP01024371.1:148-1803(+)
MDLLPVINVGTAPLPLARQVAPSSRPHTSATNATTTTDTFTRPATAAMFGEQQLDVQDRFPEGKESINGFPEWLWRFGTVERPDTGGISFRPGTVDTCATSFRPGTVDTGVTSFRHGTVGALSGTRPGTGAKSLDTVSENRAQTAPWRTSRLRHHGSRRALHSLQDDNLVKTHAHLRRSLSALLLETKEKDKKLAQLEAAQRTTSRSTPKLSGIPSQELIGPTEPTAQLMTRFHQDATSKQRIQRVADTIALAHIARPNLLADSEWAVHELWELCEWCTSYWLGSEQQVFDECVNCSAKSMKISHLTDRLCKSIGDSLLEITILRDQVTDAHEELERARKELARMALLEAAEGKQNSMKTLSPWATMPSLKTPLDVPENVDQAIVNPSLRRMSAAVVDELVGNNNEFYDPLRFLSPREQSLCMQCVDEKVRFILSLDPKSFDPRRVYGFQLMKQAIVEPVKEKEVVKDTGARDEKIESLEETIVELQRRITLTETRQFQANVDRKRSETQEHVMTVAKLQANADALVTLRSELEATFSWSLVCPKIKVVGT